jgi:AraC-like DNA-binding protein
MAINYRLPCPPLDAYVAQLRSWEGPAPYPRATVLPAPTLHLLVNFGDDFAVYRPEAETEGGRGPSIRPRMTCGASYVMGLWDTAHVMEWPRASQIVGVTFRPGGAAPFLFLPLSELRDRVAPLEALWGRAAAEELRKRLYEAPTAAARLALFERLLLARLARHDGARQHRRDSGPGVATRLALVRYAAEEIAHAHGGLAIRALSDQLGVSHQYLIAQFNELVGSTPKALARVYRLHHALEIVARLDPLPDADPAHPGPMRTFCWARVAQDAGYYDEAHFNREFAALTGLTPTGYLQGLHRFRAEHSDSAHALAPRFLPIGSTGPSDPG